MWFRHSDLMLRTKRSAYVVGVDQAACRLHHPDAPRIVNDADDVDPSGLEVDGVFGRALAELQSAQAAGEVVCT